MRIIDILCIGTNPYAPPCKCVAAAAIGAAGTIIGAGISSVGSNSAAGTARRAQQDTNAANIQMARETNAANTRNVQSQNATNIRLQQEMNQWNLEQWQRNNAYNEQYYLKYDTPEAKRNQLMAAGFNPAMYNPNGSSSAGYSASPVQQVSVPQQSIPNLVTPQVQNPEAFALEAKLQAYQHLSSMASDTAENVSKIVSAKKDIASANQIATETDFRKAAWDLDLGLKSSEIKRLSAAAVELQTQADMNRQSINESVSRIANLDADTQGKVIDNFYKGEFWQKTIDELESKCNFNKAQIAYIEAKLPFELGLLSAQTENTKANTRLTQAQTRLADAQTRLTDHQVKQVDAIVQLVQEQKRGAYYANNVMQVYGMLQGKQNYENSKIHGDYVNFMMDDFVKYMGVANGFLTGLGSALGGAAAVKGKAGVVAPSGSGMSSQPVKTSPTSQNYLY